MSRYKIINILGRYKHVYEACHDINNYALGIPLIRNNVHIFQSSPMTTRLQLDKFIDFTQSKYMNKTLLLIHCFPNTNYAQLKKLNQYIDSITLHAFQKVNLYAHGKHFSYDIREQIMKKHELYNDLYCTSDFYDIKYKKITNYIFKKDSVV
jgi:hypothetical protein